MLMIEIITFSNSLSLRSTLLLGLNCCYETVHTNMGTIPGNDKSPGTKLLHRDLSFLGTKSLGYEKSVIRIKYFRTIIFSSSERW